MVHQISDAEFASTNGGDLMVKITISGHPGSGTSTLVGLICERMDFTSLNGGDVFREQAKEHGMSLADFGKMCTDDESVDQLLDQLLRQRMEQGPDVIESRLAGWWAYKDNHNCVRLWLDVSLEERARRLAGREGIELELALDSMTTRESVDDQRFEQMYGFTPGQSEPYTHILDASAMTAGEVADAVQAILEE